MSKIEEKIAQMLLEHSMKLEIRNAGVFRFLKSYRFESSRLRTKRKSDRRLNCPRRNLRSPAFSVF